MSQGGLLSLLPTPGYWKVYVQQRVSEHERKALFLLIPATSSKDDSLSENEM